ncbi:CAAX protease self-immunity [Brevibacterium iodinum ATCC 49514]|uniref:CAAX protease self-immunity n=1 Tax=Brevibacterium iodinum ATCC 49514 TaxID=1255616 RepID=A0A2H1HYY7_9MICO|nr:type II CAAX endopeptidase family protein [Brevibacterium iodinum]SMX68104.1 CAAX protease self-immunity [Brevibacterium iodinum ATCC 49514]SUW13822.1 CAAX amino terminal protease self- immunity [Brevibacterium iodinum]
MRNRPHTLHYHRQFAALPGNRWCKPLLVAVLAAVFYLIAIVLFVGFFLWALFALGADSDFNAWSERFIDMNTTTGVLFGLISVILMWPAAELATLCIYRRLFSSMFSLRGGMRWGRLGRYLLVGAAVWVVCAIVMVAFSDGSMGHLTSGIVWNSQVFAMLVAIILLVPFQATAEEVVFRGLAMNIIGSWLRHPAWAVLIPVPFFVVGHVYDLPGLIDVGIFAVIVGALTIITGGLEAGIAFHIVNNVFAFGLGVLAGADLNATSAPTVEVVMSIAAPIVFGIIVVLDHRRRGGSSFRRGGPSNREPMRPLGDSPGNEETAVDSDVNADPETEANLS